MSKLTNAEQMSIKNIPTQKEDGIKKKLGLIHKKSVNRCFSLQEDISIYLNNLTEYLNKNYEIKLNCSKVLSLIILYAQKADFQDLLNVIIKKEDGL